MTTQRPHRLTALVTAMLLALGFGLTACTAQHGPDGTAPTSGPSASATADAYTAPNRATVAALPEAQYDAVIGGLVPYYQATIPKTADEAYTIRRDAPLYGDDRSTPVARLSADNFLGTPTVVVPVKVSGAWALIMTPARQALPSVTKGGAAAQSAAWVRRDLLRKKTSLEDHVVISAAKQTLSIVHADGTTVEEFPAGVGATGTPTPTGVIGYIQARYLDPAQQQTTHPIQLTTLHSAAADEPYGGQDGGLIGVHYQSVARGAISHGCVRLDGTAVDAVDALPLGTIVQIVA
ncbi:L,D-transpeptidase [Curtobacterium sp. RRHDQ10]|uniref:L,D-transpeptidase n=1 Tax=Curtobacterium phyllosphaerae TaxID=3413379 RepID=UPI003BF33DB6